MFPPRTRIRWKKFQNNIINWFLVVQKPDEEIKYTSNLIKYV